MIMKCVRDMDKYRTGDEITAKQLVDEGYPQCIIDYCFVAVPEKQKTVKLAIIEDQGRIGCWVAGKDYPAVFGDQTMIGMSRWLPLSEIPGTPTFMRPTDAQGRTCPLWWPSDIDGQPAGHAAFAVFAAKE